MQFIKASHHNERTGYGAVKLLGRMTHKLLWRGLRGNLPSRNLNYWDSVSTLAGEVPMPHKTFPRALFAAVVLVVLTYALPLMVGLGVTRVVKDWKLGYFSYIAQQVSALL